MTRQEAAEHMRITTRQLDKLRNRGAFPETRNAGTPLFEQADLDEFLRSGKNSIPEGPF
jgi:hypothetical protein